MEELVKTDVRSEHFCRTIRFIGYEIVQGDIVEFGVYTGRSLAILSHYNNEFKKDPIHGKMCPDRKVFGIDSFQGLAANEHIRWPEGIFRINHSKNPVIEIGENVSPESVKKLFTHCNLESPIIIESYFSNIDSNIFSKIALVHIDCDLYESTLDALNLVKDKLQNGTIILFDDWFNFKGDKNQGEQKAFYEFLDKNPNITAIPYHAYATFCNSFIISIP